ncbi:hypothetical protein QBC38DRAFT_268522 [Podospora fimiseda]|uniref:Uncharacterized protein n=1 Tax=Podospora fimiseda TaxID=252190 RepID=A0AAN7GUQ0_9PEZI|nr:hypothetical protein QBC38DRAFT_268522 [Podospora fimiseda]
MAQPPEYPPPNDDDVLPPYKEEKPITPFDNIPPTTYNLLGLEVHTCPRVPDAPPAYILTREIHMQGPATQQMDISRVDSQIRISPRTGRAIYSKREKQLYNLQFVNSVYLNIFESKAQPYGSTRSLGQMRIEKAPTFHHGYRVIRVISDDEKARLQRRGEKVKEGYWWSMKEINHGRGWEWRDPNNVVVARQITEVGEGGFEEHKLEVIVELPRRMVDSLVSMWCLWMWRLHIQDSTPKRSWADRKNILERKRDPGLPKWDLS